MTTTTDRATELRAEIEGHEAYAGYFTAAGRPCDAQMHRALANDLREELEGLS